MRSGSELPRARLYTAASCSLCGRAHRILERLEAEGRLVVEAVDISSDPELTRIYGERVPVVVLSSGERYEGRISEFRLRRVLQGVERRSAPSSVE